MANNKDFKIKNGIKPTSYFEGVGTPVSTSTSSTYDIANMSFNGSFADTFNEETSPVGLFFKPDGTKMYVCGTGSDGVTEYDLDPAWSLSSATFNGLFSTANETDVPEGVSFKPDGSIMYVVGGGFAYQYDLDPYWDVTTASNVQSFDLKQSAASLETNLFFKPDGTKAFTVDRTSHNLREYDLSTDWDITSASNVNDVDIGAYAPNLQHISFKPDGTKIYVLEDAALGGVVEFDLSTAWDTSTIDLDTTQKTLFSDNIAQPNPYVGITTRGFFLKPDGTKLYLSTAGDRTVTEWSISKTEVTQTLDLSKGSVFEITPTSDISLALSNPADSGVASGATLLLDNGEKTRQWDITTAVYDDFFSVSPQEALPTGIFFKPDGTKMYIIGSNGDEINEYDLGIPWDATTAVFNDLGSVATEETNPQGIFFKPDGSKVYIVGTTSDSVHEYHLGTNWDIDTIGVVQETVSVAGEDLTPRGLAFKSDGTRMYVLGGSGQSVYEYGLSTPWDIGSAGDVQNSVSVADVETVPHGLFFKSDGSEMYVVGTQADNVSQFKLQSPWELTGATFTKRFSVATEQPAPQDLFFKPDGARMYIIGQSGDDVDQYDLGAKGYTLTYDNSIQFSGGAPSLPEEGEVDVITFNTIDGGTSYQAVVAIQGAK